MVAIAAIAQGNILLLAIGLAVSIPLIVAGAALVLGGVEPLSVLIWAGTALLGWIAGELIVGRRCSVVGIWSRASAANSRSKSHSPRQPPVRRSPLPQAGCGGCWHESERRRERPANKRRLARIFRSVGAEICRTAAHFRCTRSSSRYDVDRIRARCIAVAVFGSHGCAVFLGLVDRAIGFWPSGWCCLADTNADDTYASDFPPKSGLWRYVAEFARRVCWLVWRVCAGVFADIWND